MDSTFDCYTPLRRPELNAPPCADIRTNSASNHELEEGECDSDDSSVVGHLSDDNGLNGGDSSDEDRLKGPALKPERKRTMPRPQQITRPSMDVMRKKYDIWSAKMREDSLTETMRNFGVNRSEGDGERSVEWYDYTLGNRFSKDGKINRLKRRRSGCGGADRTMDDEDDDSNDMDLEESGKRRCYNNRQRRNSSPQDHPRALDDLVEPFHETEEEVAKELTENLKENNEALILQITQTLGADFVRSIYKETQRIELDGGMMIMNGRRRRTSGGVFLFLVKHSDDVSEEQKRTAFKSVADTSEEAAAKREEEIEELKKSLITTNKDKDSPTMRSKLDLLKPQDNSASTLSNPPPSPVYNEDDNNNINCYNDNMDFN